MRIITLPGDKREIGKTTTTVNLGVAPVEMGRRVSLLDTNPQALCSRSVGVVFSDPVWSLYAAPLSHTFLTETELTVRSSFGNLRTGSLDRLGAALFSIIKWPYFRLSKFKRGIQSGLLFDQQMALFSVDKNRGGCDSS